MIITLLVYERISDVSDVGRMVGFEPILRITRLRLTLQHGATGTTEREQCNEARTPSSGCRQVGLKLKIAHANKSFKRICFSLYIYIQESLFQFVLVKECSDAWWTSGDEIY